MLVDDSDTEISKDIDIVSANFNEKLHGPEKVCDFNLPVMFSMETQFFHRWREWKTIYRINCN